MGCSKNWRRWDCLGLLIILYPSPVSLFLFSCFIVLIVTKEDKLIHSFSQHTFTELMCASSKLAHYKELITLQGKLTKKSLMKQWFMNFIRCLFKALMMYRKGWKLCQPRKQNRREYEKNKEISEQIEERDIFARVSRMQQSLLRSQLLVHTLSDRISFLSISYDLNQLPESTIALPLNFLCDFW